MKHVLSCVLFCYVCCGFHAYCVGAGFLHLATAFYSTAYVILLYFIVSVFFFKFLYSLNVHRKRIPVDARV